MEKVDNFDMYEDEDEEFSDGGWIQWFCNLEGHEFFAEIEEDYIRDNFNLYGLRAKVGHYSAALDMILSPEAPEDDDLQDERFIEIYQEATDLYGLIHARFILSPRGLAIMREKYQSGRFGFCPRVMCERQNVLPVGMSEDLRTSRVKVFCPKCEDVYIPKQKYADVDGAYFGCSFPHILLQTYPDLIPAMLTSQYIPRIYGFRIYKKTGSRAGTAKTLKKSGTTSEDDKKSKPQGSSNGEAISKEGMNMAP
mmetsp:Transcript_60811/g.69500  ORF Transcript_60811/g.69500 Transcript_60811/m.69500 type:complete len:252 (+) Transcript_60811:49-804(+)|eukprot:CAMPEP_0115010106 /NCGR_PEP_ID=MMETSP0216-20121206/23086_1 /TAXON_ID=223996 /ORGANISM="Protocruzia adherens, Strain Boccale" /LENGTH=251 /DNA_ID=CAMNT_0002378193 /DNA_START=49 /DNA_END=804 /DNA_ORIENTATION=+